jgi:hypothetical protein
LKRAEVDGLLFMVGVGVGVGGHIYSRGIRRPHGNFSNPGEEWKEKS